MNQQPVAFAAGGLAVALCALLAPIPGHIALALTPLVIAGFFAVAAWSVAVLWRGYRHQRLAARLQSWSRPAMLTGIAVQELPEADAPFVAGLSRPRIFCSPALRASLAPDELRAVLLHERYHQIDRAPAKLVLLETLAPFLNRVPAGGEWLTRRIADLEIAADRHALAHGSSRPALARALLKLAPTRASFGLGIGFASAADLRLKALLDDVQPASTRLGRGWMVVPVIVAVGCATLALLA